MWLLCSSCVYLAPVKKVPKTINGDGLSGPNSALVVYVDPLDS